MAGGEPLDQEPPSTRLRILVVAPMPAAPEGPGAIPMVLHAGIAGLSARHDVTLVAVAGPAEHELEAAERLQRSGVEVHAVQRPQPSGGARWRRRLRMALAWLRGRHPWRTIWFAEPVLQEALDSLVSERRFDLIHAEDNSMGVLRYPAQVPRVLTEHEVRRPRPIDWPGVRMQGVLRWTFHEADWWRWPRYQIAVWERFDRVQVFTPRDAKRIEAVAPQLAARVRVTPFGIALPRAADPAREEPRAVLFVGNFTHAPNVDAALWIGREIMPLLRRLAPGVHLRLVGADPPRDVRALAGRDVEVTGTVPDVESFFARSALLLAPLRIGGGMRMKVLEAMARGKAVVTTRRGVDGLDAVGADPPAVIAERADELADAAARLLGDPPGRAALARQGREFAARHFSADAYARRLEATYAELVRGHDAVPHGG